MGRSLHDDLNDINLFIINSPGQYTYFDDGFGSKIAYGVLEFSDADRNLYAQKNAGGDERRGKHEEWGPDDGGHLIASRFGGSSNPENLIAMNRNVNRSVYKKIENDWASHLNNNEKVFVNIETSTEDRINGRSEAIMGYVIYEDQYGKRDFDAFHILNESKDEIESWYTNEDEQHYIPENVEEYIDINNEEIGENSIYSEQLMESNNNDNEISNEDSSFNQTNSNVSQESNVEENY